MMTLRPWGGPRVSGANLVEVTIMQRYLLIRSWGEVSEEQMLDNGRRSKVVRNEGFPDIVWEHSHVVTDRDGKVRSYCVYQAPSEERLYEHAAAVGGHFVDEMFEIGGDVSPDDFPV
jgi:hypothetical protein